MAFSQLRLLIFSEDPDALAKFYRDILELPLIETLSLLDDYGYMFAVGGKPGIWIGKHSQVKGASTDNFRHMCNLYSDEGVQFWYEKIKKVPGVTIIAPPFVAPFSTKENQVWFCTFLDPEGNCLQFVGNP